MRNKELVDAVTESAKLSPMLADLAIASMVEHMTDALASGESVSLPGFGKFELRSRAARQGRNPATGEEITIPAQNTVGFKPGKALKECVKAGS